MFSLEERFHNTAPQETWLKKNVVLPTTKTDTATQPGSFACDIKPLLRVYKLLGSFPIHINDSGYAEFRLLCPLTLYTVLVQASLMVAAVFLGKDRLEYIKRENPSFGQVLMEATFLVAVLYVFLSALANFLECGTQAQYISLWTDYQRQYKAVVGKSLDLDLRQQMKADVLYMLLIVSMVTSFPFVTLDKLKPWYAIPFSYCVFSCVMNTGLWRATGLGLVTAAIRLREELEQLVVRREFGCPEKIAEYRVLWLKLGKLTQDLGNCMGITYGTQFLGGYTVWMWVIVPTFRKCILRPSSESNCEGWVIGYFIEQVLAVYGLLSNLEEGFNKNNFVFVADSIIFSWLIFVTCNTAQRATDEVGRNTQDKLQNLSHKFPRQCSESRQEVRYFIEAIAENPPQINFSGFVVVNRGLQTSLMSAMVTYLVVLIQFQISVESTVNKNETYESSEE